MPTSLLSLHRSDVIKGMAILAVLVVHVLAYLPGIYHGQAQVFFISLDQLARFCVPAFLIISGYGLASKYEGQKIAYLPFIKKRIGKLLPLYLLWSLASILIIRSVPAWSFGNQPMSVWLQLLAGQADYQLYFLIVLFQLYALFPVLWLARRKPNLLLAASLFVQIASYLFYASQTSNSDRLEYLLFVSWLGYFGFGIYLKLQQLPRLLIALAKPGAFLAFALLVFTTLRQINQGLDPLPALKFTKLSLLPFALLINLSLITTAKPAGEILRALTEGASKLLAWLGQNSYLIFLAHTIGLRIIYALMTRQLDAATLTFVVCTWLLTIYLSLIQMRKVGN